MFNIINLIKKKEELKPFKDVERKSCPFYGFNGMYGHLIDSEGNECAITNSYSPCQMEIAGEKVSWENCYRNTQEVSKKLEEVAEKTMAFPKEFWPPGKSSWKGISLKEWMNYILKRK